MSEITGSINIETDTESRAFEYLIKCVQDTVLAGREVIHTGIRPLKPGPTGSYMSTVWVVTVDWRRVDSEHG